MEIRKTNAVPIILLTADKMEMDIVSGLELALMEYHAGDEITVRYRADLQTGSSAYEKLEDHDAEYVYKTYKVKAIVSFPYMYDCNRTLYPLFITSDRYIREIWKTRQITEGIGSFD